MAKRTLTCYLCSTSFGLKDKDPDPIVCPVCNADLTNPDSEAVQSSLACEHIKGSIGVGTGELFITNKRIFWIPRKDEDSGNVLVGMISSKNANKVAVDVTLDNVAKIEDVKKLFRKGVTLHTKNGDAFNLFGDQKKLRDLLTPYAAG